MKEVQYFVGKIHHNFSPISPDSLLVVYAGICQIALVNESGMIITLMGMRNRSENGRSVWDTLYNTTP
jgi:hypothetical protein